MVFDAECDASTDSGAETVTPASVLVQQDDESEDVSKSSTQSRCERRRLAVLTLLALLRARPHAARYVDAAASQWLLDTHGGAGGDAAPSDDVDAALAALATVARAAASA
jgi:hypothetical protein